MKTNENGLFIISLDYESMWGAIFNEPVYKGYENRTREIKRIIDSILSLFMKHDIHATWAIVGGLACNSKEEACRLAPVNICSLNGNESLAGFIENLKQEESDYYFQKDVVSKICKVENQEIGTHTFSHFYMYEHRNPEDKIDKELTSSKSILGEFCDEINTLILPKNQVDNIAIEEMKKQAIKNIRGVQVSERFNNRNLIGKVMRFIDAYIPICGKNQYSRSEIIKDGYFDIRASRFWRTYDSRLSMFEALKIKRIKNEMKKAALNGEIYHLWFHPHNIGTDIECNLRQLESILTHYSNLNEKYGFTSCNMNECSESVIKGEYTIDKRNL